MKLRPYQHIALDHMLEHERCALWAGMGMGKTVSTLTALDAIQLVEPGPALVLAPLRVAQSTWPEELAKWPHLSGLGDAQPIVGSEKQRAEALKKDRAVFTMNYDNLPWLVRHLGAKWPYTTVVADEATRLKGFRGGFRRHPKTGTWYYQVAAGGGRRTGALGRVAHTRTKRFIELTGTPAPNGLKDLWGQLWFVDAGRRLGNNYTAFSQRWFTSSFDGFNIDPKPEAQAEISALVKDVCLTIDAKDWFDLKDPIVSNVYVDLPPAAMATYRAMEKQMFAQIGDRSTEAFNAAHKTLKCLQIANGAAYVDPVADCDEHPKSKEWREVHDAKLQALDSIVAEANGAPVLVAYHFRSDLVRLQRAFPSARVLDADPATITQWNAGRIPILLAHPQSAGHGLNLQYGGNILVYFGHWWNAEERMQILERIGPVRQLQAGFERPVWVYNIVARGTVDEDVIFSYDNKCGVNAALMSAAKRR